MRQEVLDYIQTLNLGTFIVSSELPWDENGTSLYLKNLKKIYVDVTEYAVEPIIRALNGLNITRDTLSVKIYFANDAKSTPPNYDEVVSGLQTAKNINTTTGYYSRECQVQTSYNLDKLVTEIELRFIKLT